MFNSGQPNSNTVVSDFLSNEYLQTKQHMQCGHIKEIKKTIIHSDETTKKTEC